MVGIKKKKKTKIYLETLFLHSYDFNSTSKLSMIHTDLRVFQYLQQLELYCDLAAELRHSQLGPQFLKDGLILNLTIASTPC